MVAFAGWEKVDRLARALGVTHDDPRRQVAAVEACLYKRLDAKHTLTPQAALLDGVCAVLGTHSIGAAQAAVDRALGEHAIIAAGDGCQPLGAAVMEKAITNYLHELQAGPPGPERNLFSRNLSSIIVEAIASFEKGAGLRPERRAATGRGDGTPSPDQCSCGWSWNRQDDRATGHPPGRGASHYASSADGSQRACGSTPP